MRTRGFEVALTTAKMVEKGLAKEVGVPQYEGVILPKRESAKSAGNDFRAAEDTYITSMWVGVAGLIRSGLDNAVCGLDNAVSGIHTLLFGKALEEAKEKDRALAIKPFQPQYIHTGVKAYMLEDEALNLYVRSSTPKNFGLILANSVGIIDSDYYGCKDNDGEIILAVYNLFPFTAHIKKGERIGQGVFNKFLKADGDAADGTREGGEGSTNNS